jgi:hypothetical protein
MSNAMPTEARSHPILALVVADMGRSVVKATVTHSPAGDPAVPMEWTWPPPPRVVEPGASGSPVPSGRSAAIGRRQPSCRETRTARVPAGGQRLRVRR